MSLTLLKRRLRPSYVRSELRRIGRKVARKIRKPDRKVFHLPSRGPSRGRALVSYITDAFLLPPGREIPHSHTNYWESRQIGITLSELGYDVDFIHWTNSGFVPTRPYDVFIDPRLNMERLAPLMGEDCIKIQHIETGHYRFHNQAQQARLDALEARRGVRLKPKKMIEENRAIETADFGITTGNQFTIDTYAHAGRPIFHVPISAPYLYPSPADKDFESCRRTFLWFGSGGLVHKGLDVTLEAFKGLPDHRLFVCGPVHVERDFEACYAEELYETENIRTVGWVDVASDRFLGILGRCVGLVYPSCSEGGGGAAINCLHAGIVPLLTYETSVDLHDFGELLPDASVETIQRVVREVSALPAAELRRRAVAAWEHARREHTRERFAEGYRGALEEILRRRQERST